MFGNLGNLAGLLKNAGQIKANMEAMAQRLKEARYTGEAGGGQVVATVDGRGQLLRVKIDPAAVEARDVELLEDLICAAVNQAVANSRAGAEQEMQQATGGLDLGGLMDMFK